MKGKYIWFYMLLLLVVLCSITPHIYTKYLKYVNDSKEHKLQKKLEVENILQEAKFQDILTKSAKIPDTQWDIKYQNMQGKDKYKIVFITNRGGEYSYAKYLKYAAEKIGWEVHIYEENILGYEKEILNFDPDFILLTMYTSSYLGTELTNHRSKFL